MRCLAGACRAPLSQVVLRCLAGQAMPYNAVIRHKVVNMIFKHLSGYAYAIRPALIRLDSRLRRLVDLCRGGGCGRRGGGSSSRLEGGGCVSRGSSGCSRCGSSSSGRSGGNNCGCRSPTSERAAALEPAVLTRSSWPRENTLPAPRRYTQGSSRPSQVPCLPSWKGGHKIGRG